MENLQRLIDFICHSDFQINDDFCSWSADAQIEYLSMEAAGYLAIQHSNRHNDRDRFWDADSIFDLYETENDDMWQAAIIYFFVERNKQRVSNSEFEAFQNGNEEHAANMASVVYDRLYRTIGR
jgi:hypothetical protein